MVHSSFVSFCSSDPLSDGPFLLCIGLLWFIPLLPHFGHAAVYLEQKDPLAYTGPEHHAAKLFRHKNDFVRLIPIKKALAFSRTAGTVRETQGMRLSSSGIQ
jgi:hypothetical protein